MDELEQKQKIFEQLCDLTEGLSPEASQRRVARAGFKSNIELTDFFMEPGTLDEFWDYCVAAKVGLAAPIIIKQLVDACCNGSHNHIKTLLQMINKLRPEAEQHLHLQIARQSDDDLIQRAQTIMRQLKGSIAKDNAKAE